MPRTKDQTLDPPNKNQCRSVHTYTLILCCTSLHIDSTWHFLYRLILAIRERVNLAIVSGHVPQSVEQVLPPPCGSSEDFHFQSFQSVDQSREQLPLLTEHDRGFN